MATANLVSVLTRERRPGLPRAGSPHELPHPEELAREVAGLVSLPDVCLRVFELLQSGTASAQQFGEVIANDPNLAARLLRIVNSPYYGFTRRVDTITRAVAVIGTRELYSLVLSVSAVRSFAKISSQILNMESFWRHSAFTALIARALAQRCRVLHPERLFVAGLLHDIGCLILLHRLPELMQELLLVAEGDEAVLHRGEQELLGFSHADVGAQLLKQWDLPERLYTTVGDHHAVDRTGRPSVEGTIVHVADLLANRSEIGALFERPRCELAIEPDTWSVIGLDPADVNVEEAVGEALMQFTDTVSFLTGRS